MDSHGADRSAELHHRMLATLGHSDDLARRARRRARAEAVAADEAARWWRVFLGRRLVIAGLRIGLPPRLRPAAGTYARSLLAAADLAGDQAAPGTADSQRFMRP